MHLNLFIKPKMWHVPKTFEYNTIYRKFLYLQKYTFVVKYVRLICHSLGIDFEACVLNINTITASWFAISATDVKRWFPVWPPAILLLWYKIPILVMQLYRIWRLVRSAFNFGTDCQHVLVNNDVYLRLLQVYLQFEDITLYRNIGFLFWLRKVGHHC